MLLPSELVAAFEGNVRFGGVAVDTETSGLYPDDGGHISTVCLAWRTAPHWAGYETMLRWAEQGKIELKTETIIDGYDVMICSTTMPFDQGIDGKPEHDHGQVALWAAADNMDEDEYEQLLVWLARQDVIMHSAIMDCMQFWGGVEKWPDQTIDLAPNLVWDTMDVANLIWPLHSAGLDDIGERLWGAGKKDATRLKKWLIKNKKPVKEHGYALVPWEIMRDYALRDPRLTLMAWLRQVYEIERGEAGTWLGDPQAVHGAVDRRLNIIKICLRMEQKGIPYDTIGSKLAGDEADKRAAKIAAGLPFSPATGDRAKEFWFGEGPGSMGLVPYEVSQKTQEPSLTAEVVQRMVADEVPHADTWAEHAKAKTAASMWYHGYADAVGPDGRLRTRFRPGRTASTRHSVERVNLQAIPADYRLSGFDSLLGIPTPRQLIAAGVAEGWRIWELDLAQAELRVGALYSHCTPMLEMMEQGVDLHDYTTKELFGLKRGDSGFEAMRQVGKRGNFSLGFDSGGETFRQMVSKETGIRLSLEESNKIVRDWRALFPEWHMAVVDHMNTVIRRQNQHGNGWIQVKNKERRWWKRWEDAHKAFNQRVQMSLAQFGNDWSIASDDFLSDYDVLEENGGGLVLTIHDSQVLLLPVDIGQELADQCAGFANMLWKKWFKGVDGWSEAKAWKLAA